MKPDIKIAEQEKIIEARITNRDLILTKEEHDNLLDAFRKGYDGYRDFYTAQRTLKELEPIRLLSITLRAERIPRGAMNEEVTYFIKTENE